ncbi:unnamed protein product [Calypogeia fissa]
MDFDEYDYLEKTVENPEGLKESNGDGGGRIEDDRDRSRNSKRRSEDDGHGHDHRSKRNRPEEDGLERSDKERGDRERSDRDRSGRGDRDRDRSRAFDRRSPEHRSRDRDRVDDKERERSDRGEKDRSDRDRDRGGRGERGEKERSSRRDRGEKDRERERSEKEKEKDRSEKDGERERVREKDTDKDRDKDRERERSRAKSSDRHREKEKDREKEKEREAHKEREKERESYRERDREHRRSREAKERKEDPALAEPEADPERDQRTVFAYQICLKADERDVYEFFSRAGKVRDVRLIMDRNSRRSKGVGYIEFYDAMSVPMAIALSGQLLLGQPVMVKPSEAEKNLVQSTTAVAGGAGGYIGPYSGGARRLYVGNLHFNMTEDQLRQVFEPFGPVELVQLPTDPETGQCKGFGFVQYARLEDARAAQQNLNGVLEIGGRPIKVILDWVSAVSDQIGMQDIGVNPGELDDDEGGGLSLNARSRALLMQKLDRSGTASGVAATGATPLATPALGLLGAAVPGIPAAVAPLVTNPLLAAQVPLTGMAIAGLTSPGLGAPAIGAAPVEPIGVPSEFLLLKYMFDPKLETEPDFDQDIKEDVQEECSKFGQVKHIFVDKNSAGHVYLRFDSTQAAISAQRALHGRWFAGKMITATFMTMGAYETKFPESK